jgi:S-adenosyl-L-methionine hydrolase (adenosine-forming)
VPSRSRRGRNGVVTLTTDIGWAYAAQMKAVLLSARPDLRVIDLAHDLPAHQIREAAFVLRAMAGGFPPGSVHVAVVDPGVGGPRAPLVLETPDGSALVGPDNGILAPLAELLGGARAFRIDLRRLGARPRVGTTFDGRDVFAPAAARLAAGAAGRELGVPSRFRGLDLPAPSIRRDGVGGEVVHVDRFGNLITNIPSGRLPAQVRSVDLRVGTRPSRTVPRATSYLGLGRLRLGILGSSFGTVEVAVGEGNAAERLGVGAGVPIRLRWRRRRSNDK